MKRPYTPPRLEPLDPNDPRALALRVELESHSPRPRWCGSGALGLVVELVLFLKGRHARARVIRECSTIRRASWPWA